MFSRWGLLRLMVARWAPARGGYRADAAKIVARGREWQRPADVAVRRGAVPEGAYGWDIPHHARAAVPAAAMRPQTIRNTA